MSLVLNVLERLNNCNIKYCIFKEFDLIEKTILGEEDIDILIGYDEYQKVHNILVDSGYKKCKWRKMNDGIMFYLGYDANVGAQSLLHIHTKLRIGTKREKQLHWKELEDRILNNYVIDDKYNIRVISPEDEICLLFIRMILRKKPNNDDFSRLEYLSKKININNVPLTETIKCMIGKNNSISLDSYILMPVFGTNEERKKIEKYLSKGFYNKIKIANRCIYSKIMHYILAIRKKMQCPDKPVRSIGHIYAVVGVDGCGKSTLISNLKNDPYLKLTGIKVIYGGNNNYWIPGIDKTKKGIFFSLLRFFDKRMRIIFALLITLHGKTVVFDRYYYDDYIAFLNKTKHKSFIKKVYDTMLRGWIGIRPRKAIFLDIDPQTAYERKQDYSFDKLCSNIANYRRFLKKQNEVVFIDATLAPEIIKREVINLIATDD